MVRFACGEAFRGLRLIMYDICHASASTIPDISVFWNQSPNKLTNANSFIQKAMTVGIEFHFVVFYFLLLRNIILIDNNGEESLRHCCLCPFTISPTSAFWCVSVIDVVRCLPFRSVILLLRCVWWWRQIAGQSKAPIPQTHAAEFRFETSSSSIDWKYNARQLDSNSGNLNKSASNIVHCNTYIYLA